MDSILGQKNTKGVKINLKGTRMQKINTDYNELRHLGGLFQDAQTVTGLP